MNLSDFFERIFVINLDDRTDRLEKFMAQFADVGMEGVWNIERFPAVDVRKPENVPPEGWSVPPGAWGCRESHHQIIRRGIEEGWRDVLIFEDDAIIRDKKTFRNDLRDTLAELPDDWQQFYLGLEHFHQPVVLPTVVSQYIHRTGNGNRTHAYALTLEGMKIVDEIFTNWRSWDPRWHCDWALGYGLHETGKIICYNARPHLFIQDEGFSDIMGRKMSKRAFENFREKNRVVGPITVKKESVGYGELSVDGTSGYNSRRFRCTGIRSRNPISAHASSRLEIDVKRTVQIRAVMDDAGKAWVPITVSVDGETVGTIQTTGDKSAVRTLHKGTHVLEFSTTDNRAAMTAWDWWESSDPVIEILSNCRCPNQCPGCNQREFMTENPDYEFTPEDAKALVDALEKYDRSVRVCFTGGEPALWGCAEEVMAIFNASDRITGNWVVTSRPEEEHILRLKSIFDKVFLSKRTATAGVIDSCPLWLSDVTVWDQTLHALPLSVPDVKKVDCCCAAQGIVASLIGQTVYPCVVAKSLQIAGRWPELVGVSLESYFTSGLPQPIGSAKACLGCANNIAYRRVAKKAAT